MIKFSALIKRKPGMSSEDFHRHWTETHKALALGAKDFMSHIRKYVQCHQIPEVVLKGQRLVPHYDGIVELWADSLEEMNLAFATPGYRNIIQPDEANFCDETDFVIMVTEELRVVG